MPRFARLDSPGVLHHIMIRGIERRKIFRDDKDRNDLIERLSLILPETNTSCYAWALLSNHAHFLFRSGEAGIAKVMRKEYLDFVEAGVSQGRKPELTGGGLIRSLGGWKEVKKHGLIGQDRIKSDERILGDSGFAMEVLEEADERYDRRYMLKSLGYDVLKVERKVITLFDIEKQELYSGSRKKPISEARSLFCYWCVRELGESMTSMARLLGLTQPAIGYAVDRGKRLAKRDNINLLD